MSNVSEKPTPTPPASNRGMSCFLIGCLTTIVICVLLCGGVLLSFWIFKDRIVNLAIDTSRKAAKEAVEDSEMSDADKVIVNQQIDRVAEAYKSGQLSTEQLSRVLESLVESPLFVVAVVYGIEQKYIAPSGLTPEEKTAAHRTLERTARGLYEGKITQQELDPALQHVATKNEEGDWKLKEHVTDEELRAFLAKCNELADSADIPDEPFTVNIGEEVKKAVDAELGPAPAPAN